MSTASDEPQVARLWQGQTGSERAEERRRRLVEAGYVLLGTEGASAVSVRAVTRESGLSPKYFYESFTDREDLLRAVFEDLSQGLQRAVGQAMSEAPDDFRSQARASLDATARCLERDPRLARALLRETLADDTLRALAEEQLPEFVLAVALQSLPPDKLESVSAADLQVWVLAVSGAQVGLLLAWSEGRLKLTRDELVERMHNLILAVVAPVL